MASQCLLAHLPKACEKYWLLMQSQLEGGSGSTSSLTAAIPGSRSRRLHLSDNASTEVVRMQAEAGIGGRARRGLCQKTQVASVAVAQEPRVGIPARNRQESRSPALPGARSAAAAQPGALLEATEVREALLQVCSVSAASPPLLVGLGIVGLAFHFGFTGFLTPRNKKSVYGINMGEVISYSCVCKAKGHIACNRSLSNSISGSEDMTLRMLRYWILLGEGTSSKDEHKARWQWVEDAKRDNSLPSLEDLELMAMAGPLAEPMSTASSSTDRWSLPADLVKCDSAAPVVAPGTPPGVRKRCQELVQDGLIKPTTAEQRRRNRRIAGTEYRVPPMLLEALEHSYIAPMLPPPEGMQWKRFGADRWFLGLRGG